MQHSIYRRIVWVAGIAIALAILALGGRPAHAQDAQWLGQFWNNRDLSGPVVLSRYENTIDFNWFGGSPAPTINDDDFSARWTRVINFAPGTYRFFATMDDGMRVWVDNQLVIDSWTPSQVHTLSFDRAMNGNHSIRIDYFEAGGMAEARFNWQLLSSGGGSQIFPNWQAEYFNNTTLSGAPVLVRDDVTINQNWGAGSPGPGVNADFWSVRWNRQFSAQPGQYRIILTSDDGSRLFINNELIIDSWQVQAPTSRAANYFTNGGTFNVRVEFFESEGNASMRADLIVITGGLITVLPPPPTGGGTGTCVTTPSGLQAQSIATGPLNVRNGPSTQFEVIGTLAPCQIVPLSGFRNADSTWVQIVMGSGRTGWVSADYVRLGTPISSLTPTN
jgi:hypothetical protein